MKAKILYLYYDIMNLYGENGNIRMIERVLKNKGAEVEIDRKTITDSEIDFMQYDFIYCGAGTELSRDVCMEHLRKLKESLISAFESGKVMLFTGNSYEMLGATLKTAFGEDKDGLGLFSFNVQEQSVNRYSGDVSLKSELFSYNIEDSTLTAAVVTTDYGDIFKDKISRQTSVTEHTEWIFGCVAGAHIFWGTAEKEVLFLFL